MSLYHILKDKIAPFCEADELRPYIELILKDMKLGSLSHALIDDVTLSYSQEQRLGHILALLSQGASLQHALGWAEFGPLDLQISSEVLVPRPETYELVNWALDPQGKSFKTSSRDALKVIDLGTGSGCIALSIKARRKEFTVLGVDLSEKALEIANLNAKKYHLEVQFELEDILKLSSSKSDVALEEYDMVVSNPPYICRKERTEMEDRVLNFEPELALFVPDDDPLLYYRSIALWASIQLKKYGFIYFEINENYLDEVVKLLNKSDFINVETKRDAYGHERFVRAQKYKK